jgi:hypothetical protein
MSDRIADELARDDLTTQIQRAIKSAVRHYSRERFWFNEARSTASTTSSTEFYAVPSDFLEPDILKITVQSYDYPLIERDWEYLEEVDSSNYIGQPTDWGYFANQFRVYPVPDGMYVLTLSYLKSLETLSATTDTNAWMVEGEELIRARAKWDLYANILMEPDSASMMKQIELEAFSSIKGRSNARMSTGKIRPTYF